MQWPLNVPVLADGVVTLRAHTPDDLDRMLEMARDPDMVRWTAVAKPHDRAMSEQFALEIIPAGWNDGSMLAWAIEVEGQYAGNVDIRGAGPVVDIGFALHPDCRGHGVMKRAVALAVDHAFTERGKEVIHWRAQVGNLESLRVAHACGFELHGTVPGMLYERERVLDAWTGSIRFGDAPVPRTTWRWTTLETPDFRLRPLEPKDDPRIREALDDELSRRWLFARPDPFTLEHAAAERTKKWWNAAIGEACTWAVVDKETDDLLADVTLLAIDEVTGAEVGYWSHPEARGRGVLKQALPAVIEHALDRNGLDLRRLTLYAAASNQGSNALALGAGFRQFGVQTLAARTDGVFEDLIGYEYLRRGEVPE